VTVLCIVGVVILTLAVAVAHAVSSFDSRFSSGLFLLPGDDGAVPGGGQSPPPRTDDAEQTHLLAVGAGVRWW